MTQATEALTSISIGITCYNAEDTIERAIRSAQAQDWPNVEILVVDDASSDNSRSVIEALAEKDQRIRFIPHETNRGYPGALNTLLRAASGTFIAYFDDDDFSQPQRLRRQFERISIHEKAHPGKPIYCYTNRDVVAIGEDRPAELTRAIGRKAPEPHGLPVVDFLLLLTEEEPFVWGQFGSCTLMTRRENLLDIDGFDENFRRMAEWDMAIRASEKDAHFIAVDDSLVTQFKTHGVGNEKSGRTPLKYALQLREKHREYLKQRSLYQASRAMARVRFHYARGERMKMRGFVLLAMAAAPRKLAGKILGKSRIFRRVTGQAD